MVYAQHLPKLNELRRLGSDIKNYPISDLGIIQHAEHLGYGKDVIDFLKLFYHQMIFKNRTEFLSYCSLLERMLKQEIKSEPEFLRSPQG